MEKNERKYYNSINGLRTIACIGIVMMHMLAKENNPYIINGFLFNKVIPSFTNFTFLFMAISAFGMCVGYRDKILNGTISLTSFYKKRYMKILPFFSLLVLLDLIMDFNVSNLYEAIADLSLTYGLFKNEITVIGVGWFLGLVFAFYMIFPFFCVMVENKRRAWLCFFLSLILNFICGSYFGLGRENIVYSMCYFLAGGLIYLYRMEISHLKWFISVPLLLISIFLYYFIGGNTINILFVVIAMLMFALGDTGKILDNSFFRFFSQISMEVYLCHMFMFRILEKLHLNIFLGNGIIQYVFTVVMVLIGASIFSYIVQFSIDKTFKAAKEH